MTVLAAPEVVQAADGGTISGVVRHPKTKERVPNAIVVLQCTCLQGPRETQTNAEGLYAFRDLPPGTYTIQVLVGQADQSKVTTLPRNAKFRADFTVDPEDDRTVVVRVKSRPVEQNTSAGRSISMDEYRNIPIGNSTSRDFTAVVESSATASRDSAGISLAGTTGAESKYTVDGANVNNPAFGTVGSSLVQEFIETVDVQESGYEAEFGGVSGGQVRARRISGTNKLRGTARFTYTPRLAKPRFIVSTDNAVRATETPDYFLQGVVAMTGPVIKDKLFWTGGVSISGGKSSLVQSFHSRIDKDGSGGYEDCPFENGEADCVDGGNYIQTEKFAEQVFPVGVAGFGYIFGLDWVINPRHRISASVFGGPGFRRRSYRRATGVSLDPAAFGTALNADPLGGASLVANGVVNDHFGWDRGNDTTVVANYLGRLLDDKLEVDATFAFSQFTSQEAWKLDDESFYGLPATQETDADGADLWELLDRDQALNVAPGVDEACNERGLPGLSCPVRQWLSGGIGNYSRDTSRRISGRFSLTHFFNGAGSHQLKWGAGIEHEARRTRARFSGSNASDFDSNCESGQTGGGEWCYDPDADDYVINNTTRVNNHRLIFVDTDNPDDRTSAGYGRVRHEQGELRAIASPRGAGIRADEYNERLSTQNYHIYLQDKWAIRSNLYVSAGVRWQIQDMRDIFGERALLLWDNVAPRVGVVYDWTDEGRSRLFGSYGWFYQNLPLQLNNRAFGGQVNVFRTFRNSDCVDSRALVDGNTYPRYANEQPTEWCADFNSSTSQLTEGAVVPDLKGMYTQQFQLGYEQEVIEDLTLGIRWLHTNQMQTVEDVSTDGAQTFIIANPGEPVADADIRAQQAQCEGLRGRLESLPVDSPERNQVARELVRCDRLVSSYSALGDMFDRPVRNFDAFTFEIEKRFARNWLLNASYTYRRLVGNYDGFVDPITGAINLGSSQQFDIPEIVRNSYGPLSFDSPHNVKLDAFYSLDLKEAGLLTFGTSFRFQSGYPISLRGGNNRYPGAYPVYVVPRGAGGRIQPNYNWNLAMSYAYPVRSDVELEIAARVINVTNSRAVLRVDDVYTFQNTRAVAGGDLSDLKHSKIQSANNPGEYFQRTVISPQGNYGVETSFQTPLAASFDVIVRF